MPASRWFFSIDWPPDSIPNGAGELCYKVADSCHAGPNSCETVGTKCTAYFGDDDDDIIYVYYWFVVLIMLVILIGLASQYHAYDYDNNAFLT